MMGFTLEQKLLIFLLIVLYFSLLAFALWILFQFFKLIMKAMRKPCKHDYETVTREVTEDETGEKVLFLQNVCKKCGKVKL